MISLLKYTKNYRKELILGPTFKFLEAVFELLLPLYMARLIDQGIAKNDNPYIIKTAITMIVMSLIGLICVLICQYYAAIASQGFGTELRNQLFKKINTLSYQDINRFGTVTLITRMTSDINQLQLALAMLIRLVIRAPFLSVGSIVMAFYLNSQMALIFILTLPLFCLILYWMMKKTIPLYKKVQLKLDQLNLVVQENLSGVRVIRAFGQKKRDIDKLAHTADALAEASKRVTNISAVLNPATILIMNTAIVILLYVGGVNVNNGSMTQGQVLALINYLMQMLLALIVVANLVVIFTRASASASRVNEVLNVVPSINDTAVKLVASSQETLCLEFKEVSFRYEAKSGLALDHISFKVKGGETLGIIGPTGSGKTTLSQLIPRFYDVTTGEVSINHVDVGQQSLSSLRSLIAIVPQTSILFTGTIKDNLCWGKQDATDEECWQALKTAQCLDFVTTLPLKLETVVREGGKNFSGGQRQRLAIARALIKQPALLILDDSLSALDYQTDQELRRALKRDMSTTLIIIISQRLSSIKHAQQILVLDNGQQVGLGTHQELLASTTTYQEIVLSQQEQEEE